MNFNGCKDFSTSLKPIPYFDVFADMSFPEYG